VLTSETAQARQYQSRIHAHDPIGANRAAWPSPASQTRWPAVTTGKI
jgi:hypothetical protein